MARRNAFGHVRHVQQRRDQALCFPVFFRRLEVEALGATDRFVECAEPSSAMSSRTSSAMKRKKFWTNSGFPVNVLRS